jgi:translation initiation factor 6
MKALQTDFYGDHNVGLFAKASDKVCIAGSTLSDKSISQLEKVLKVPVVRSTVANSEVVGIFCAVNSNGLLLPKIASDQEFGALKAALNEHGMAVERVGGKFTALGNLVLCNDKGVAVSRLLSKKELEKVEDVLGVEADYCTAGGLDSIGSCGLASNKGCVMHRDSTEEELDRVQDLLGAETDVGTGNFGSPFVGSCAIANSNGIVAGESTTGPEITRMMETLGLV